jgi:AbrB family looped-hinge helix DNA binding protein
MGFEDSFRAWPRRPNLDAPPWSHRPRSSPSSVTRSIWVVPEDSKYQVVIPEKIRRHHSIHPGDKLAVIAEHGVVHLVPVRPFEASKGMFKGSKVDHRNLRDRTDRF